MQSAPKCSISIERVVYRDEEIQVPLDLGIAYTKSANRYSKHIAEFYETFHTSISHLILSTTL